MVFTLMHQEEVCDTRTAAKDKEVPASLRSRLRDVAGQLGYDASGDTPTLVSGAAAQ